MSNKILITLIVFFLCFIVGYVGAGIREGKYEILTDVIKGKL